MSSGKAPVIVELPTAQDDGDARRNGTGESSANYVAMDTELAQLSSSRAQQQGGGGGIRENDGIMHGGGLLRDNHDRDEDEEEEEDLPGDMASITSSVLTADGIHDYPGFWCVCFVILVGDMSRGVMFPSMWPLVEALGGSKVMLGYSVAAFSFGRVLMNPVFGSWSHQIGYSKTLLASCSILLVGTLVYAQIQNVGRPEFLIVAQTLLGVGSGTLGVTRAFVADVTARRNRTKYMAWITAVQYGGFTVTPAFGALFNKILGDNDYQYGIFRLNMFTAPAYFMSCVIIFTLYLLSTYFKDRTRVQVVTDNKKQSRRRQAIDEVANQMTFIRLTIYDCCMLGCMLLNVATKGCIASFETLGIAIAQEYFDMLSSRAGLIIAVCGSIGVVCLLNMGLLEHRYNDVQIITGGMLVMAVGIVSLSYIENDQFTKPSWSYVLAMFLIYSVGYPIGHTAVIGLFSKSKSDDKDGVHCLFLYVCMYETEVTLRYVPINF